jgi:hypothetical protein
MQPERARKFRAPPKFYQEIYATRPLSVQEFIAAADQFGKVTPAQVYAVQKTGKIITSGTLHQFTQADQDAWIAAAGEYRMPREKIMEIFHQTHEHLRGAHPYNIISSALSYAVNIALDIGMSVSEFTEILNVASTAIAAGREQKWSKIETETTDEQSGT